MTACPEAHLHLRSATERRSGELGRPDPVDGPTPRSLEIVPQLLIDPLRLVGGELQRRLMERRVDQGAPEVGRRMRVVLTMMLIASYDGEPDPFVFRQTSHIRSGLFPAMATIDRPDGANE